MAPSRNKIVMAVERFARGQQEQFSPVHRINGFPWRLKLSREEGNQRKLSLVCEKSSEAELWECKVIIHHENSQNRVTFSSWGSNETSIGNYPRSSCTISSQLQVQFTIEEDGDCWALRPSLTPTDPLDGILVFGDDKKKIEVNKASLAAQSPFFHNLFNGNFKEKNMREIPIGDVEYEDFVNVYKIMYGLGGASLTDGNVYKVMELADRFDLKIVEDGVVSFLLSYSCHLSVHQKLLFTEHYNLPFLKDRLYSLFRSSRISLGVLGRSPEWDLLSKDSIRGILSNCF